MPPRVHKPTDRQVNRYRMHFCPPVILACALAACAAPPRAASPAETPRVPALRAGLDWLVRHRSEAGGWEASAFSRRCAGPGCATRCAFPVDDALTGLAVLALLRAPPAAAPPDAAIAVRDGLHRLLQAQHADGRLGLGVPPVAHWNHILPALALAEAAAERPADERMRGAARAALACAARQAGAETIGDCEAPWYALAFEAGRRASLLDAPPPHAALLRWLDWGRANSQNTTPAIGPGWILCRLAAGEARDTPAITALADEFAGALPSAGRHDFFLEYLGLAALQETADPRAAAWEAALEDRLLTAQHPAMDGCPAGSWDPDPVWGSAGGRVAATAFAALILERLAATTNKGGTADERG